MLDSGVQIDYPKISIITPSYNQGNFIEQTILSVIEQGYPNLEYIIIDGGSNDNTVEIIKKYVDRISYWVSEPDKGQSDAINKGLKMASGEIINWLNSDDYYEPGALFKVAKLFGDKSVNVVAGRSHIFKGLHQVLYDSQGTDVYENNLPKTIGWARIDQPETFFRRDAISKVGILDTRLHYLMDKDWWIKYLFCYGLSGIQKTSDVLVNFRLHDTSKTVSQVNGFIQERDTFYYGLAKLAGLYTQATFIKENISVDEKFTLNYAFKSDKELVAKAFNYYYLLRANEFYVENNKALTALFLSQIDVNWLAEDDKGLWRKLYYRNRYLPTSIINLFRK